MSGSSDEKKKKTAKTKDASTRSKLEQRYGGLLKPVGKANGTLWDAVDAGLIQQAIHHVTQGGDSILFSRTRDGSALTVCIMVGDERVRQLTPYVDDMDTWLQDLVEGLKKAPTDEDES